MEGLVRSPLAMEEAYLCGHFLPEPSPCLIDRNFDEVTDNLVKNKIDLNTGLLKSISSDSMHIALGWNPSSDLVDIPPVEAHFSELSRLYFDERRIGKLGEPPGDLGFATAGGSNHEDVFGDHLNRNAMASVGGRAAIVRRYYSTQRIKTSWVSLGGVPRHGAPPEAYVASTCFSRRWPQPSWHLLDRR